MSQFCENCGAPLPDEAKFCEACGAKVMPAVTAEGQGYEAGSGQPDYTLGPAQDIPPSPAPGYENRPSGPAFTKNTGRPAPAAPSGPSGSGGGIATKASTLDIGASTFADCEGAKGGAIYYYGEKATTLTVSNTTLTGCNATGSAGATGSTGSTGGCGGGIFLRSAGEIYVNK